MANLFSARTTDGASPAYTLSSARGAIAAYGTFDSCTITISMSIDGTNYINSETFTEDGIKVFSFIKGGYLKATVSSAGGSTSISVDVREER